MFVGAALVATLALPLSWLWHDRVVADAACVGTTSPDDLTGLFDLEPDGLLAADYQRALRLPDGRILWTFQDASIRIVPEEEPAPTPPPQPGGPAEPEEPTERIVHNAALVQSGTCFERLGGGPEHDPTAWLFPNETVPFERWFWPLDATIGADGLVWVFLAEVVERGPSYLTMSEPVGTHVVALDPGSLEPVGSGRPADAGADLYGFSIAEDGAWTYLYAQCHRQFGYDPTIFGTNGHDLSCSDEVTVGRVARGRVLDPLDYWDGTSWQPDPGRAVPVMPSGRRQINPSQVMWNGSEFLSVTKEGDWLGSTIYLDRAPAAHGPWTNYARMPATPKCAPNVCNTYFASWIPQPGGGLVVGLSHNRWDGVVTPVNRPTFAEVPPPAEFPLAMRCSLVDC